MFIGERLKEERERLRFTQTSFSKIAGVSSRAQINYEKGERTPDGNYLAAIAKIGADVIYILTGLRSQPIAEPIPQRAVIKAAEDMSTYNVNEKPLNKREQALLANYRESDEEGKRTVESTARAFSRHDQKEGTSGK